MFVSRFFGALKGGTLINLHVHESFKFHMMMTSSVLLDSTGVVILPLTVNFMC